MAAVVSRNLAAPAVSRVEHGAQGAVEREAEVVGFIDQQGWVLAVNRMVDAGRGDAVGFERTQAHGRFERVAESSISRHGVDRRPACCGLGNIKTAWRSAGGMQRGVRGPVRACLSSVPAQPRNGKAWP